LAKDLFVGLGSPFWVGCFPASRVPLAAESLEGYYKLFPLLLSFYAFLVGEEMFRSLMHSRASDLISIKPRWFWEELDFVHRLSATFTKIYVFLSRKWYFDELYNRIFVRMVFFAGHRVTFEVLDRGMIERLGALGAAHSLVKWSKALSVLHVKSVNDYALFIIVICGLGFVAGFGTTITLDILIACLAFALLSSNSVGNGK